MKIRIVFETMKLRLAFWAMLCVLIGLCVAITLEARAIDTHVEKPGIPDLPVELRDRFELQTRSSAGKMVLIDFYSDYCGVCQMMEPTLKSLKKITGDKVSFERLDIAKAENAPYEKLYDIKGTPSYYLFDADGKAIYRMDERISPTVLTRQVLRFSGMLNKVQRPTDIPALTESARPGMVLMVFLNKSCPGCAASERYVKAFDMADEAHLSVVQLDADQPEVKRFMKQLELKEKALPSFVMLAPDDQLLLKMTGSIETPERARSLWDVVQGLMDSGV
jgi:thiol-disulfide isomerase/thioredoxin